MFEHCALVLAGGKASRFQTEDQSWSDKALACANGKPLLVNVVLNLQKVVDEIVICVNDQQRQQRYSQVLEKHGIENVKFVLDEDSPIKGPLLAIMSGLHATTAEYCLTVPTDMPFLKPKVIEHMFKAAQGVDVAVPMWPDGTLETLLMAFKRESAAAIAETLLAMNKASADSIVRGAAKLRLLSPMQEIKNIDPEFRSFININTSKDLIDQKTRSSNGKIQETTCFDWGEDVVFELKHLRYGSEMVAEGKFSDAWNVFAECVDIFETKKARFWAGVSGEKLATSIRNSSSREHSAFDVEDAYLRAARNYQAEAEAYAAKGCCLLAEKAQADKEWCQKQSGV